MIRPTPLARVPARRCEAVGTNERTDADRMTGVVRTYECRQAEFA
jgi:hypothetical protein